ncbi:MAG: AI-2E family transporter [Ignavibacteriales bacterium]|nr:MAG: AI-2E family transporter [Ignavibacteriales bacterium]
MPSVTTGRAAKIILWFCAGICALILFYLLLDVFIILVISILLAFIFHPAVLFLEKLGIKRGRATAIIFLAFGFSVYLLMSVFIPTFVLQMNELIQSLRYYSLHDQIISLEKEIQKYLPFFDPGELSTKIEEFISGQIINSFDQISTVLSSIVSIIAILVIVPFITFFVLKDSRAITKSILHVMPNKYFELAYWIIKRISVQLGRFVRGWIFDATFVGVALGIGFYILGLENSLPLGVISGLGHLVPYFGPIIGGIPAAIISIIQFGDLSQIPYIAMLVAIVYTLDNGFVQPYVFSKSVDMHPIVIILLIIAGSQLFGIIGMLLAVPFATVMRTAVKEIYFALKNYKIAKL